MPAAKKALSRPKPDFKPVVAALRNVLEPYAGKLVLKPYGPDGYYLESRQPTYKNRPMFFAAVKAGKNYVSFHLMPVYCCRELLNDMSPALKKRMQGKACFNFTMVDDACFKELAAMTKAGYRRFKELKYL